VLDVAHRPLERTQGRRQGRRTGLNGLLALGALLFVLFRCEPTDQAVVENGGGAQPVDTRFGIEGDTIEPLSPGTTVRVDLTMTNPHEVAMAVSGLTITVDRVTAPRADRLHLCSVDDFTVEQPGDRLHVTLPAEASRSLSGLGVDRQQWPEVGMVDRPRNQDGCKGALVTLSYTGSGTLQD
jgi:hypothetical protein